MSKRAIKSGGRGLLYGFLWTLVLAFIASHTSAVPLMELSPQPAPQARPLYVPDQVLVQFKPGTSLVLQEQTINLMGVRTAETMMPERDFQIVKLDGAMSVEEAMSQFRTQSTVALVQPNYYYYLSAVPNDPLYGSQWGLNNAMQTIRNAGSGANNPPAAAGSDMAMQQAWDVRTNGDCSNIIVAVIDSGINYTHDDLDNNMWVNAGEIPANGMDDDNNGFIDDVNGWDFLGDDNNAADLVDADNNPLPYDGSGHGTHVAGTIGAEGNNALGGSGVCWSVQLMNLRALSDTAGSTVTTRAAVRYAVDNGARVINMSLGGAGLDPMLTAEIENARQNGVIVVAAAGNGGADGIGDDNDVTPQYPCNLSTTHDNVVCVAALDQAYAITAFSNFGVTSVNVGAPGNNILSTWPAPTLTLFDNTWTYVNGGGSGFNRSACGLLAGGNAISVDALKNPASYCDAVPANYDNNQIDVLYKAFDFSLSGQVRFSTFISHTLEGGDSLTLGFDTGAGANPFDGANDAVAAQLTGNTGGFVFREYTLTNCNVANCGIGFQFVSDNALNAAGSLLIFATINAVENNSTGMNIIQGTSMATPHVSGLAAMLLAHNPNYSYLDAIESIENAGDAVTALSGKTTSGRAVDAYNSLLYIGAPDGLSASVVVN